MRNSNTKLRINNTRDELRIQDESTIFVSGANFFKIIPELIHLWAAIIKQVKKSKLILYPFGPAWSSCYPKDSFIHNFRNIFAKFGIDKECLIILDSIPSRDDIKKLLLFTDVYLDAVPYSGATSLIDPLEVGVPPVVMEGSELRFKQGAMLLKDLGIPNLITGCEEDYIKLSITIAKNRNFRNELKDNILAKMRLKPCFLNSHLYAQEIGKQFKLINSSVKVQNK